jgi:hypothetical protein
VVPVDCGWSDLGTWDAVAASASAPRPGQGHPPLPTGEGRGEGSVGPAKLVDSPGAFTWSDGPAIVVLGLPGIHVVASGGGVLVAAPDQLDRVGKLGLPAADRLDSGPGWAVERRVLAVGDAVEVGPDDHATVVSGAGRGERVPPGRFVAGAACVLVVVRLKTPSRSAGATGAG